MGVLVVLGGVKLVESGNDAVFGQFSVDSECTCCVHICSNNRYTGPVVFRVFEGFCRSQLHFRTAVELVGTGLYEHITKIHFGFHNRRLVWCRCHGDSVVSTARRNL